METANTLDQSIDAAREELEPAHLLVDLPGARRVFKTVLQDQKELGVRKY